MRQAQAGSVAWLLLVGADLAGWTHLGLVTLLLALAPLVVVPLGFALPRPAGPTAWSRLLAVAQPVGALAVAGALLLPTGGLAAAMAGVWVGVCLFAGADEITVWWRRRSRAVPDIARLGGFGYLCVGATWLVLDRLGVRPLDLPAEIVELTAVHFHYAGFAAALMAGTATALASTAGRSPASVATLLVLAGAPVVAAGFAAFGPLQIAGAVLLTVGLLTLAWVTVRSIVPNLLDQPARWLLTVSSLAVVVPMLLAVQWAVGHNYGTPALPIPDMALFHGSLNAFGFTLCGLLGWLRATNRPDAAT
ncbi:MAG: YndJ family transporter [Egibacteraceae bacterium]